MIDLHLHLDGSLSPKTIIKLAEMSGVTLPAYDEKELLRYISADINCEDLNEYLKCFDLPLSVMQSAESLEHSVCALCEELKTKGMKYVEIRFAPQLHTKNGLSQTEVVSAAIEGIKRSGFFANLILCCMRGDNNIEENLETVRVAKEFLGKGVVAVDLAGAEGLFKTESFAEVFKLARELNVPFTIHAGEADGAESVRCAVEFGAKRIGHGVRSLEDMAVVELIKEKNICLEMCPTSNIQTKAVADIADYPIKRFMELGVCVTLNTDNMTVSGTNIENEFELLKRELGLTEEERNNILKNAVNSAFLSDEEKTKLMSCVIKN